MTGQPVAELLSVDAAFGRAALEAEGVPTPEADPGGTEEASVSGEGAPTEEAVDAATEQPGEGEPVTEEPGEESIFDDLEAEAPEGADDLWEREVEIEGFDTPVPLKELRDGYLRQADYTRKTQALAEQRKSFDEESSAAKRLYDALAEDAPGTIAYLAKEVGLVDEEQLDVRVRNLRDAWKPPLRGEELEEEIERRVAERVSQHPSIQEADHQRILAQVDRAFADLETKHEVRLSQRDREKVLQRAIAAGTSNLELVFNAMQAEAGRLRDKRGDAAASATSRPGTRDAADTDKPPKVRTVEDAFNQALAEGAEAA